MAHILIIEDDGAVRMMLQQGLLRAGFTVSTLRDGSSLVPLLEKEQIDLIVTDIFMPDVDGLEVIATVRHLNPVIPIIAVSGGSQTIALDFLPAARALGANEVMAKPFSIPLFIETVKRLLPLPAVSR